MRKRDCWMIILVKVKGGPGSGNWAHIGRQGVVGGSAPRDSGMSISKGSDWLDRYERVKGKSHPYALQLKKDKEQHQKAVDNVAENIARAKENFHGDYHTKATTVMNPLSKEEILGMSNMEGAYPNFRTTLFVDNDTIRASTLSNGSTVMITSLRLHTDNTLEIGLVAIENGYTGKGLGEDFTARVIRTAKEKGLESISLEANISIGRYAWAKKGFDYRDPDTLQTALTTLGYWCKRKGITLPETLNIRSANDMANFRIPGVKIKASQIKNEAVPVDLEMDVGKAFMLDRAGHGSWYGILRLK